MQLIGKVTNVQKVRTLRGVDVDQGSGGGTFAQMLEKEADKREEKKANGVANSTAQTAIPVTLEGKMNGYNQAKTAYFYMTFCTTDLKG